MPISYFFDRKFYLIEITINNFNWWNQSKCGYGFGLSLKRGVKRDTYHQFLLDASESMIGGKQEELRLSHLTLNATNATMQQCGTLSEQKISNLKVMDS